MSCVLFFFQSTFTIQRQSGVTGSDDVDAAENKRCVFSETHQDKIQESDKVYSTN